MANKKSQKRLTIPKDIWDISKFDDYNTSNFGFFITDDSRIVIMCPEVGNECGYEYIGLCHLDHCHRFFLPKNVDIYLGEGDDYYFSTYVLTDRIYFYKLNISICQKRQNLQLQKLLASL